MDVAAPTLDPGPSREAVAGGPLEARWLGRIAYREAWALQHALVEERIAGRIPDQLLLLEHPAVLTLGRQADEGHVRASIAELEARGIELIRVERGGEVTYHGPGQLVAYPILALSRRGLLLRPLVRALEGAMVDTCASFGVLADRREGHPGCWCDASGAAPRKIGALGIRVERGVSYHGIALNVDPDLADFDLIDPCGMPGVASTSIALELRVAGLLDRDLGLGGLGDHDLGVSGLGDRHLGVGGLGDRDLGVPRTSPAEGSGDDARRGITPANRDFALGTAPISNRFDARWDITGSPASIGGGAADAVEHDGAPAGGPATFRRSTGPAGALGPADAPNGPGTPDRPGTSGTPDAFDAPEGISEGGVGGRSTHDTATFGSDAPMGITWDPHAPELSVERAARAFARAFADRLGAELIGPGVGADRGNKRAGAELGAGAHDAGAGPGAVAHDSDGRG